MQVGYDRGHAYRVLLNEVVLVIVLRVVMSVKLKERRESNVSEISIAEVDLEAAKVIFDDKQPQQGVRECISDSGTAKAEN